MRIFLVHDSKNSTHHVDFYHVKLTSQGSNSRDATYFTLELMLCFISSFLS